MSKDKKGWDAVREATGGAIEMASQAGLGAAGLGNAAMLKWLLGRSEEERQGHEQALDKGARRDHESSEESDGGHLESDWAGRSILHRYLTGGGDWTIDYDWGDVIDPNPQYSTDQAKSLFAEVVTLGQAEA